MTAALSWPLQQGLYTLLTGDAALTALLGGAHVYDGPPHGSGPSAPDPPYVVFGDETARAWSTQTGGGAEITLTLEVWSRERGFAEIKQILARLSDLLTDPNVTLARGRLTLMRPTASEVARAAGRRRGRLTVRALVEDTTDSDG